MSVLHCVGAPLRCTKYLLNSLTDDKDLTSFDMDDIASDSHSTHPARRALIYRLLKAKEQSGMSFSDIATYCGITNVYCAQLFHNQAQLRPRTARRLLQVMPHLTQKDILDMSKPPLRVHDSIIQQEPHINTLQQAMMHNGNALKGTCKHSKGNRIMLFKRV